MPTFADAESAATVRGKLNNAITRTDWCVVVADVSELANLVYTTGSAFTVAAGTQVVTAREGFSYEVLASGASTFDIQPGAVKLEVLPTSAGHYNFDAMLPAGDGTTDDYAKLKKLLDKVTIVASSLYQASPSIYFPPKRYYIGQTLELRSTVHLLGSGGGFPNNAASMLVFPADTTGIVVNRFNTDEDGGIASTTAADWSGIENLIISGSGTGLTHPGILIRARCAIRGCTIGGFGGNGISVIAAAGFGGSIEGNANLWYIERVRCSGNRGWGFYCDGADANAGNAIGLDCASNGRGGIWDSSFLGNTYVGCHVASNGTGLSGGNSSTQSSFVSYGGSRYSAHWTATEAELVATEPGTDPTVWILDSVGGPAGGIIPTWTPGQPEGTYFVAFGYWNDNVNAQSVFLGCYSEGGASGNLFQGPCLVIGGSMGNQYAGDRLRASTSGGVTLSSLQTGTPTLQTRLTDSTGFLTLQGDGTNETWRLKRQSDGTLRFDNANSGLRIVYEITGPSSAVPYQFSLPAGYILGGKRVLALTAAPTTGTWARGDYVRNSNPAVGSPKGWFCTVAGTPGTWVSEGNL